MRRLAVGIAIVAAALGPSVAWGASPRAAVAAVGISPPVTVATNVVAGDGNARVLAVSCARTGSQTCGAVGEGQDGANPVEGFAAEGSGGAWGPGVDLTGVFGEVLWAQANALSCPSAGDCVAGGYFLAGGSLHPWVDAEHGGTWGTAFQPAASIDSNGSGQVNAISCPAVGDCTVVGTFYDATGYTHSFVERDVAGTWQDATDVSVHGSPFSSLVSIDCTSISACVAVGSFDGAGVTHGYEVEESKGAWGTAATPGHSLERGYGSSLSDVSCATTGNCVAVGSIQGATQFHDHGLVVEEARGAWRAVRSPVPTLFVSKSFAFTSIACPAAGQCTATGRYFAPTDDPANNAHSFVSDEHGARWSPLYALANEDPTSWYPPYVSCSKPHDCVAVGTLWHPAGKATSEVYAQFESNGVWSPSVEPMLPADLGTGSIADAGVSCSRQGSCEFGGGFTSSPTSFGSAFVQQAHMSPVRVIRSFAAGTATISSGLRRQIVAVAHEIAASASGAVLVAGYDDGDRTSKASLRVSSRRAYAVTAILKAELKALKVTGVRFTTTGLGAADHVQRPSSTHGRAPDDDRVVVLY